MEPREGFYHRLTCGLHIPGTRRSPSNPIERGPSVTHAEHLITAIPFLPSNYVCNGPFHLASSHLTGIMEASYPRCNLLNRVNVSGRQVHRNFWPDRKRASEVFFVYDGVSTLRRIPLLVYPPDAI
ncbi:hypothetical protein DPEC_G00344300 [Dallia pectoralis]|uniref:Uncharacterized protein n=1 Tax=Dallia pectoralis TaxID=75939 RepID=A0ACC2F387_DALPE|nr:hypothetical protein DPEC_G00344300 [Dallia pectoralis]